MFVVLVTAKVKAGTEDAFLDATFVNARESLQEPGIARFDVIRSLDDPSSFLLIEAYRGDDDPARHKKTPHYLAWRDAVEPMMALPRTSVKYDAAFVPEGNWGRS